MKRKLEMLQAIKLGIEKGQHVTETFALFFIQ